MAETRELYNLQTNTLITLLPKTLELLVKKDFGQVYCLDLYKFAILYYLCISQPKTASYKDFEDMMADLMLSYPGQHEFDAQMTALQQELLKYGVKKLIVKVRGGYAISKHWTRPVTKLKVPLKSKLAYSNSNIMQIAVVNQLESRCYNLNSFVS